MSKYAYLDEIITLLQEIYEHISDPKGQSDIERDWSERIDKLLRKLK